MGIVLLLFGRIVNLLSGLVQLTGAGNTIMSSCGTFVCVFVPSSSSPLMMLSALQVKVTQELKNTHTEQLGRLHLKHQTECDLLEDMR